MNDNRILFVSTVREWGGSEVLWAETALLFREKGYNVSFAARYKGSQVEKLKSCGAQFIYTGVPGTIERILRKLKIKRQPFPDALLSKGPQLVVISQGSNIDARYYMNECLKRGIPYVTIIHLVTNILWAFNDDHVFNELSTGYKKAKFNYFISKANLQLHNHMLGERDSYPNSKNISNPFLIPKAVPGKFPPLSGGNYQVALVGRLEMFHKGHDLLIQVLGQPKWKERPVTFNVYGTGPHLQLLQRLLVAYGVENVVLQGYVTGISAVWKTNHLLILPSRMEGQSLALLEAMWCHRGALVTNVGGAAELVIDGETGFMSDFPTVPHLDTALEKAWSKREDWEQIGKNAGKKIRDIYRGDPMKEFAEELEGVFNNINT